MELATTSQPASPHRQGMVLPPRDTRRRVTRDRVMVTANDQSFRTQLAMIIEKVSNIENRQIEREKRAEKFEERFGEKLEREVRTIIHDIRGVEHKAGLQHEVTSDKIRTVESKVIHLEASIATSVRIWGGIAGIVGAMIGSIIAALITHFIR